MSAKFHLAEVNVGRLRAPIDHPTIKDFADNLDRINALAEASPRFVWRLKGDGNNATDLAIDGDPLFIPNLSVWEDIPSLGAFVYRSGHIEIMRRRKEWFEPMDTYMALWWIPVGHEPTVEEALEKLALIAAHGPTPAAFTFKSPFPAPTGEPEEPELDECA
ncbi:DUF3291 domain-containing protein [Caulobacter sp. FWC2]|uniref:DUF3291 domain-containing protein n=1 Tax=Caulobacter sp. FWC2 TaxID=69664 RepID=UPI000C15953A|nr:DUF3291 domain-containing protein [Caulobacter sp. FWC2]PIB93315.1 hypothetical protein CSW62_18020 [Caulobacter sp. FWC2]